MRISRVIFVFLAASVLSSCALVPGGEVYISKEDRAASDKTPSITVEQIEFYKITASNTKDISVKKSQPHRNTRLENQKKAYTYKVGAGDVLQVNVWEHPELVNLGRDGLPAIGFLIDSQGFVFYPYVGRIMVAGKSTQTIRNELSAELSKYIENPQLDVAVTKFGSKKIYLTGEIVKPTPLVLQSQAMTLLDAVTLAGGVTPRADMNDIVVVRKGNRRHIDLYALMHYGDMRENILMLDGDQIHVASQKAKYAYVMGQVTATVTVPITPEGVTLAEALGHAGGINESSANARAVYVIRDSKLPGKVAKVHMLDLSNMAAMVLAAKFELKNEDVIYVSKSPIVKWNQLLSVIKPTLEIPGQIAGIKTGLATIIK